MARSAGFAVSISAQDALSPALANIGREITGLSRQLGELGRKEAEGGRRGATGTFEYLKRTTGEVGREFREIGRHAREAGRSMAEAFEPIGKLVGVGGGIGAALTLGGIAEGIERIAASGVNLAHTSERIGVGVVNLQRYGNAARVGGASVETMTAGLENLGKMLYSAALGQDSQAIMFFKQMKIDPREASGSIKLADRAIGDIAEQVKKAEHPFTKLQIATLAFKEAGAALLPFLDKGRDGIAELLAKADKLAKNLSGEGTEATKAFHKAQGELGVAITGVGNALTDDLLRQLTPVVKTFADWVGEMNKSPEALKAIEVGVGALATIFIATWLPSILRVSGSLLGLNTALGATAFLATALQGLGLWTMSMPRLESANETKNREKLEDETTRKIGAEHGGDAWGIQQLINRAVGWWGGSRAPRQRGPAPVWENGMPRRQSSAQGDWWAKALYGYATGELGVEPEHAKAMLANSLAESSFNPRAVGGAGERGLFQWDRPRWARLEGALGDQKYDPFAQLRYAVEESKREVPGWLGRPGNARDLTGSFEGGFERPAVRTGRSGYLAMIEQSLHSGGVAGKSGMMAFGDSLAVGMGLPGDAVNGRTPAQVLAILQGQKDLAGKSLILSSGASNDTRQLALVRDQLQLLQAVGAHAVLMGVGSGVRNYQKVNEELGGLASQFGVPFGGEPLGTQGGRVHPRAYGPELDRLQGLVGGGGPAVTGDAGQQSADSKHEVEVRFMNAPDGMRSGLSRADGPAAMTLKTNYAFGGSMGF